MRQIRADWTFFYCDEIFLSNISSTILLFVKFVKWRAQVLPVNESARVPVERGFYTALCFLRVVLDDFHTIRPAIAKKIYIFLKQSLMLKIRCTILLSNLHTSSKHLLEILEHRGYLLLEEPSNPSQPHGGHGISDHPIRPHIGGPDAHYGLGHPEGPQGPSVW